MPFYNYYSSFCFLHVYVEGFFHKCDCIIVEKGEYATGDTLVLEIASKKIKQIIKLEKGAVILLTGGKHRGEQGIIEDLTGHQVIYKKADQSHKTLKKYAFAIGKEKSIITVSKEK